MRDRIDVLREVFEKQYALNTRVLGKLGIDYDEISCRPEYGCPELAATWFENYRKALSAEIVEFITSDFSTTNAAIEVVDILHFLVSLSQIVGIPPYWAVSCMGDTFKFNGISFSQSCLVTLDKMQNACKWKWWAQGGGFNIEKAQESVEDMWALFGLAMSFVDMTWDKLYSLYMKKNAINHERQDNGYNEDTKTEADNESISVEETVSTDGESPGLTEIPQGPSCGNMLMVPCIIPDGYKMWPPVYEVGDDGEITAIEEKEDEETD